MKGNIDMAQSNTPSSVKTSDFAKASTDTTAGKQSHDELILVGKEVDSKIGGRQ